MLSHEKLRLRTSELFIDGAWSRNPQLVTGPSHRAFIGKKKEFSGVQTDKYYVLI